MVVSKMLCREVVDRLSIDAVLVRMVGLRVMTRCQCFRSGFHVALF